MKIMRGGDRTLHRYVLTNPGIGMDEVLHIAKMTTVAADLLKAIAERREWAQRPEIARCSSTFPPKICARSPSPRTFGCRS